MAHGRAPPPNPSPTTLALSHIHAALFEPPTQHHSSQPRCGDAGGVTSKSQEAKDTKSVRRKEGSWGYFSAAGQGVHHISPRRVSHQGENEQMLGASFNTSVSQGAFKDQPLSLLGPSHILPPPLEVWSLLASQNTTCVAITYMATGRAGEVDSESSFSPEEVQHGDSVFPHSGPHGIWEHKRGPRDTGSGKPMAGPGPFSARGEPLSALCRLLLLTGIFSVFPTPSLCLPVPPPFVAA